MNELKSIFLSMCDALAAAQVQDGGFACEACGFEHGRADNAVYPFLCAYSLTGDDAWLSRTEKLLKFREKLENEDGSVSNDFSSGWKGITVFSALSLYKALSRFGSIIPAELYGKIENRFTASARWVHENIKPGFRANINYYCASAAVNAAYGAVFSDGEYTERARELLSYCTGLFTENGILRGEGQPHGFITAGGCVPADTGYITGESIPCLTDAALFLGDGKALMKIADNSVKLLEFMLPDGAWDNSFGSRNNKWTYWGSRTATGCTGAFFTLSQYRPVLGEAALRNLGLIARCTCGGVLYGGPEYRAFGQKPCIHHTFSTACGLADAVCTGIEPERTSLPCDSSRSRIKYFHEINTYKIYCGGWIATVTGNDYSTYTRANGASHASGGTLSLLYHRKYGPVIAGAVSEYKRTESNNMQEPEGNLPHTTLLPRADCVCSGKYYSTAQCFSASVTAVHNAAGDSISVSVTTRPEASDFSLLPDESCIDIEYTFTKTKVTVSVSAAALSVPVLFTLPVISSTGAKVSGEYIKKEKTFFLTPGFGADSYTFAPGEAEITIE